MQHIKAQWSIGDRGPIVLVDDDDSEFFLLKKHAQLSSLQRNIEFFDNGEDFLHHMSGVESGENPEPAVVLLDIKMPSLDGFDVLEKIKQNPRFKDIPIMIMFSNSKNDADKNKAKALQADGYKIKPIDTAGYIQLLSELFPEEVDLSR